jgi:enoyl-CoA hydratase/carnithine racemase
VVSTVLVDVPVPGVRRITFDRPERLNTLTHEFVSDLHAVLDEVGRDADCRVVVLTGAGSAFSAGLELTGYGDDDLLAAQGEVRRYFTRQSEIAAVVSRVHHLRQPVIAAINGAAAGAGLALAAAADIRIATPGSVFVSAFIRAGYSGCDLGLSWLLPRIVGAGRAHELMLTGRRFDSDEALRIGFLSDVVPAERLLDTTYAKAAEILRNPPLSVELTKQGMWRALETPGFDATVDFENRQQVISALTEDQSEATAAFLGKREPTYRYR